MAARLLRAEGDVYTQTSFFPCLALPTPLFGKRSTAQEAGETPKTHKSESATGGATTSATAEVSQLYKNARRCRLVAATASSEPESELGHCTHVVLDIIGMAQLIYIIFTNLCFWRLYHFHFGGVQTIACMVY